MCVKENNRNSIKLSGELFRDGLQMRRVSPLRVSRYAYSLCVETPTEKSIGTRHSILKYRSTATIWMDTLMTQDTQLFTRIGNLLTLPGIRQNP